MTTKTLIQAEIRSLMPVVLAVAAGLFLILFAGFAEATVFHDSAHDTRHAFAFPCH